MKKIFILTLVCLSISGCKTKSNRYNFYAKFDKLNRKSTLFLARDNRIIDSISNLGSYYGKDSIVKRNDTEWDYYYVGRCGTGCSVTYYMNLSPVENKIKVKLNILFKYRESNYESQNISSTEYIPYFSPKQNYISKIIRENNIIKEKSINKINYDDKADIYYNCVYNYNNSNYKGLKIDSIEYIVIKKNKWQFYNSNTKRINDLE